MLKIFLTFFLVSFSFFVKAELRIDITQGNTEPTPLALLQFNSKNLEEEKISFDINKVVSNNLERSGLFSILPKKLFINERIELRDIFTLESKIQKARISRNPKTNEKVLVPEKKTVQFKMSKKWFININNE